MGGEEGGGELGGARRPAAHPEAQEAPLPDRPQTASSRRASSTCLHLFLYDKGMQARAIWVEWDPQHIPQLFLVSK